MDYLYLSLFFVFMAALVVSNPMVLSLMLVGASVGVALFFGGSLSKWFMVVLLLVFTGGMMIMVLYLSNIAARLKITSLKKLGGFLMLSGIAAPPLLGAPTSYESGGLFVCYSYEILVFLMALLLLGLSLIIFLVEKSRGALR